MKRDELEATFWKFADVSYCSFTVASQATTTDRSKPRCAAVPLFYFPVFSLVTARDRC
jgi:hypothetical protein